VRQRALTESPFFEVAHPPVSEESMTTGLTYWDGPSRRIRR
jgi:hypothetical protein